MKIELTKPIPAGTYFAKILEVKDDGTIVFDVHIPINTVEDWMNEINLLIKMVNENTQPAIANVVTWEKEGGIVTICCKGKPIWQVYGSLQEPKYPSFNPQDLEELYHRLFKHHKELGDI